jgi:hypothetical protein
MVGGGESDYQAEDNLCLLKKSNPPTKCSVSCAVLIPSWA